MSSTLEEVYKVGQKVKVHIYGKDVMGEIIRIEKDSEENIKILNENGGYIGPKFIYYVKYDTPIPESTKVLTNGKTITIPIRTQSSFGFSSIEPIIDGGKRKTKKQKKQKNKKTKKH